MNHIYSLMKSGIKLFMLQPEHMARAKLTKHEFCDSDWLQGVNLYENRILFKAYVYVWMSRRE